MVSAERRRGPPASRRTTRARHQARARCRRAACVPRSGAPGARRARGVAPHPSQLLRCRRLRPSLRRRQSQPALAPRAVLGRAPAPRLQRHLLRAVSALRLGPARLLLDGLAHAPPEHRVALRSHPALCRKPPARLHGGDALGNMSGAGGGARLVLGLRPGGAGDDCSRRPGHARAPPRDRERRLGPSRGRLDDCAGDRQHVLRGRARARRRLPCGRCARLAATAATVAQRSDPRARGRRDRDRLPAGPGLLAGSRSVRSGALLPRRDDTDQPGSVGAGRAPSRLRQRHAAPRLSRARSGLSPTPSRSRRPARRRSRSSPRSWWRPP